jgi:glycosyltransferase involved in cell wall biosynthesis
MNTTVIQLTNVYGKTGVGNYSRWLNIATKQYSKMYLMGGTNNSEPPLDIEKIIPLKMPLTSNWWFENRLPSVAYAKFKKYLSNRKKEEHIIVHSLSHSVPFIENEIDIVTFHDVISLKMPDNYKPEFSRLLRSNFRKYSRVEHAITTTNYVKKDLENYGYPGTIHVIGYPVDPEFHDLNNKISVRKILNLPEDKKIILSVSSAEPRKNLRIIHELMQTISDDFILVRVGKGIGADVVFDNLGPTELNAIYNAADVFLSPSLEEGFGLPVIEAMACGLPVVLSDLDFFREVADNAAIFVDPTNVKSIMAAINEAVTNSLDLKIKGKVRSTYFSYEKFAIAMKKLYTLV